MNYLESIAYLDSLSPTLETPGLARIKQFLASHGDCQNRLPCFHVGGTNGKGSTVAFLDSVLQQSGLKVGRFTGPHLLRWNERFHVDGLPISDHDFARYATIVRGMSEEFARQNPSVGGLTWFEFITVLAFVYFNQENVDVAVIEVGLGGRFDATNVLGNIIATIITNIDLDHTHILGDTEELIAMEKAGIIKASVPVITAATGVAWQVIADRAAAQGAPLLTVTLPDHFVLSHTTAWQNQAAVTLLTEGARKCKLDQMHPALAGRHQKLNALLAFAAFVLGHYFAQPVNQKLTAEIMLKLELAWLRGLSHVYWPGRMQLLSPTASTLGYTIFDGAHNPAGARALRQALSEDFPDKNCLFVISCFDNKNVAGILEALVRPGDRLYFAEAATRRATFSMEKLEQYAIELGVQSTSFVSIEQAFLAARREASANEIVVVTGSFATVRESMSALGWQTVEDGRQESVKIGSAVEVPPLSKHRSGN